MIRYRCSSDCKFCYLDVSMAPSVMLASERNRSVRALGGVWLQGWNLKELTEGHHQAWSLRLNLTQRGEPYQDKTQEGLTVWMFFLDSVASGAWPFLVRGVICLVNSDNERDLDLLVSYRSRCDDNLERFWIYSSRKCGNNRSVMPSDTLGSTRATLMLTMRYASRQRHTIVNQHQARDRLLWC